MNTKPTEPINQEPMNLDEYFERARSSEPPLSKDEVSSILSKKLDIHHRSEEAHLRRRGVFSRGAAHIFSNFQPKRWIMFSMLTGAFAVFLLLLPKTESEKPNSTQEKTAKMSVILNEPQAKSKIKQPILTVSHHQTRRNQASSNQATNEQVNLPAPYQFVEVDDEPFVDLGDLTKKVKYPEAARRLGLEGQVNVRVLVLADGSVSPRSFVEYSDVKMFDSATISAVMQTRWQPAKRGGKPVACWVSLPIKYRNPERVGMKSVQQAQMLDLTPAELAKIGVEQDTAGILQILGWKKSRTGVYQMRVSIDAHLKHSVFGSDSIFKQYVANLRAEGKHQRADEWEFVQMEHRKRELNELQDDSTVERKRAILGTLSRSIDINSYSALRRKALQFTLPRLVTDGHDFRYFIDVSDAPSLQRNKQIRLEIDEFMRKAKELKMSKSQISDSIASISERYYPLNKRMRATKDTAEVRILIAQRIAAEREEELKFEQEKSDASKLIGIRIPSAQRHSQGDEYLLWYDPTPEFISLLPERYRSGLEKELAVAKKYATKCEIPTDEERKAVTGYFDSWRSCDGVLKITSIYPNPTNINATVRFSLQEARSITVTVHNLNGERLAILEPTPVLERGEHELPLDFTGRNIGVYLLALTTDKGETAIQRIMIVR